MLRYGTLLLLICSIGRTISFRHLGNKVKLVSPPTHIRSGNDDYLSGLKVDESKLSEEERTRLSYIQRLTNEADDLIRKAGFSIDGQQNAEEIERAVKDTKWSGQSDVEATVSSRKNYGDITSRPGLAVVDMLALFSFAAVGRSNHGEGLDILALLGTAFPFVFSWFALSPFLGAYTREATKSKSAVPLGVVGAWALCVPLALILRGLYKGAVPPTPFIIVSMIATFALLCLYRVVFIYLNGDTSDSEFKTAGQFEVFKMIGTLIRRW